MTTTLIVGCGYLGRRVGRILATRRDAVFGTTRSPQRADELARWGIQPIIADVLRPESLRTLPDAERIVYCVGFDRGAGVAMREVYVEGLRRFFDHVSAPLQRLIYISSTGVYGRNDGGWVVEDDPAHPTHESGRVCLEAEQVACQLAEARGIATVVLRSSGLYGPHRIPRRASLLRGEPIAGDPAKYLNLIHIDDAARGTVAGLDRGASGRTYHLSDDRPVARREFYTLAASLLGAPAPAFTTPAEGSAEALREDSNKRISNRRLHDELRVTLNYPDITAGLRAAIADEGRSL